MKRKLLSLLLIAGAAAVPAMSVAKVAVSFQPLSVQLPDNTATYPPGPGVEVVNNNCLSCHSVEMVMNRPAMPKATWQVEVTKMRNAFKAPIAESDVPAIVDYLAAVKGAK